MTSNPTTNLALESGAAEDASVVDALPYIDGITADERHQADELIKEEVCVLLAPGWHLKALLDFLRVFQLKRSNKKPSDYLAKFAPMPATTFQVAGLQCTLSCSPVHNTVADCLFAVGSGENEQWCLLAGPPYFAA